MIFVNDLLFLFIVAVCLPPFVNPSVDLDRFKFGLVVAGAVDVDNLLSNLLCDKDLLCDLSLDGGGFR